MAEETTSQNAAQQTDGAQTHQETDWKAEARKWALETAEKANAELQAMKAAKKRADLIKATAKSHAVDEELLSLMAGDSVDEIEANAKTLKAKIDAIPKYPNVKDGGGQNTNNRLSKEDILKIKNPREQLRAAAQNLDAFD